ncbi:MAG: Trm112 family protein [bacterium]
MELLAIIVCPSCVGDLAYEPGRSRLVCAKCRLAYPIHDEIPVLLKEEALPLEPDWRAESEAAR